MLDQLDHGLVVVPSACNRDGDETKLRVVGHEYLSGGNILANVVQHGNAWFLTVKIGVREVCRNMDIGSRVFTPQDAPIRRPESALADIECDNFVERFLREILAQPALN